MTRIPSGLHQSVHDGRAFRIGKVDAAGLSEHQHLGVIHQVEIPGHVGKLFDCLFEWPFAQHRRAGERLALKRQKGLTDSVIERQALRDVLLERLQFQVRIGQDRGTEEIVGERDAFQLVRRLIGWQQQRTVLARYIELAVEQQRDDVGICNLEA